MMFEISLSSDRVIHLQLVLIDGVYHCTSSSEGIMAVWVILLTWNVDLMFLKLYRDEYVRYTPELLVIPPQMIDMHQLMCILLVLVFSTV